MILRNRNKLYVIRNDSDNMESSLCSHYIVGHNSFEVKGKTSLSPLLRSCLVRDLLSKGYREITMPSIRTLKPRYRYNWASSTWTLIGFNTKSFYTLVAESLTEGTTTLFDDNIPTLTDVIPAPVPVQQEYIVEEAVEDTVLSDSEWTEFEEEMLYHEWLEFGFNTLSSMPFEEWLSFRTSGMTEEQWVEYHQYLKDNELKHTLADTIGFSLSGDDKYDYRRMALMCHPDRGGSDDLMQQLNTAFGR